MKKEFDGMNVVVTGANRGIGKAISEKFLENGATLIAVVRNVDNFTETKKNFEKQYHRDVIPVQCEFSNEDDVKRAAKEILSSKRGIDVLVNNVGVAFPANILNTTTMKQIKDSFQINFFSPIYLTQLLSRNMFRNKKGNVIFITSVSAFDGGTNIEYTASKAAIVGAVRRLAIEYGELGIRVNGIAPSLTNTDMIGGRSDSELQTGRDRLILKRTARPEEIAEIALFLGSERSSFITGQIIRVDDGSLIPLKS